MSIPHLVEVSIVILPWFVYTEVPSCRGNNGNTSGNY